MKNTVKILILSISFAGVSTLILFFINSILKPPTQVDYANQFQSAMDSSIEELGKKNVAGLSELDWQYFMFTDRVNVYRDNNLLSNSDISSETEKFVSAYNPLYANACLLYFSDQWWNDETLKKMGARIMELRKLSAEQYLKNQNLQTVSLVLDNYDSAVDLSRKRYVSPEQSLNNRKLTDKYKATPYLCNNKFLCDKLEDSMNKQGDQHYDELRENVERLGYYDEMDNTTYDFLSSSISDQMKLYKEYAYKVYYKENGTKALEAVLKGNKLIDDAAAYYTKAMDYYSD